MSVELLHIDCMEYMKGLPDKAFDLAIVDPQYGIGEDGGSNHSRNKPFGSKSFGEKNTRKKVVEATKYSPKDYDSEPMPSEYFLELFRVSKNQIIWGANHYISRMPFDSSCWLVWDKINGDSHFADCELAWTSFDKAVRMARFRWNGMLQGNMKRKQIRIHPNEKPYQLYSWQLRKFANSGHRILDTHLGSGSSAIAAHKLGFDFVGCEIDKDYYDAAVKRYKKEVAMPLFD